MYSYFIFFLNTNLGYYFFTSGIFCLTNIFSTAHLIILLLYNLKLVRAEKYSVVSYYPQVHYL